MSPEQVEQLLSLLQSWDPILRSGGFDALLLQLRVITVALCALVFLGAVRIARR